MPILITALLIIGWFVWANWGRGKARGELNNRLDPMWNKLTKKRACKWSKTGERSGAFVEYRCSACGVAAYSRTDAAPQDCKKGLTGGL